MWKNTYSCLDGGSCEDEPVEKNLEFLGFIDCGMESFGLVIYEYTRSLWVLLLQQPHHAMPLGFSCLSIFVYRNILNSFE